MQHLSDLKGPSFSETTQKSKPSSNIGAVSCTMFFQHQTIIPLQEQFLSNIVSRALSKTVIILEFLGDIDKLLFDPPIAGYFSGSL